MLLHSSSGCYQTPSNIEDLSFQTAVGRWRRSVPVGILVAALDRPLLYMFKKNPRSGVSLSDYRVYLIMYVFMFSLCFVYIPHHTRTVPFFSSFVPFSNHQYKFPVSPGLFLNLVWCAGSADEARGQRQIPSHSQGCQQSARTKADPTSGVNLDPLFVNLLRPLAGVGYHRG